MTYPVGPVVDPFDPENKRRLTAAQQVRVGIIGVVIVIAGVLVGLLVNLPRQTLYVARAEILYHLRVENATYFMRTDANLSTQVELLTSHGVLGPVAQAHGMSVDDLAEHVSAQIVDNSELIQLDVLNADRNTGVAIAEAITKQYLAVLAQNSQTVAIQKEIDDARASAGAGTVATQNRIALLQSQIDIANTARNTAQVVLAPYSVPEPEVPDLLHAGRVGGFAGLIVAGFTCLVLFRRWTSANIRAAAERAARYANVVRTS